MKYLGLLDVRSFVGVPPEYKQDGEQERQDWDATYGQ